MFTVTTLFIRKHARIFHGAMAVTLFVSYFQLEEKPDDAELPVFRIVHVRRDTEAQLTD